MCIGETEKGRKINDLISNFTLNKFDFSQMSTSLLHILFYLFIYLFKKRLKILEFGAVLRINTMIFY